MTYPSDNRRNHTGRTPIEQDRQIVNGSILAIAAFAVVVFGIAWYALTGHRPSTASVNAPTFERALPDGTTGYGGARPRAPNPPAK